MDDVSPIDPATTKNISTEDMRVIITSAIARQLKEWGITEDATPAAYRHHLNNGLQLILAPYEFYVSGVKNIAYLQRNLAHIEKLIDPAILTPENAKQIIDLPFAFGSDEKMGADQTEVLLSVVPHFVRQSAMVGFLALFKALGVNPLLNGTDATTERQAISPDAAPTFGASHTEAHKRRQEATSDRTKQ